MKTAIYTLCLCIFILTGCTRPPPVIDKVSHIPGPNLREVSRVINIYAVELDHTERLHLENSCVKSGQFIEHMTLDFSSQDIKELKEARRQLVDLVEGLLERINHHPQIVVPQYQWRPVTADNLTVNIIYESFWIKYGDPSYVNWVLLKDGIVKIFDGDSQYPNTDQQHYRQEPYSHSRDIVMFQREGEALFQSKKTETRKSSLEAERYVPKQSGVN